MRRALQEGFSPERAKAILRGLANLVRHEPARPRPSFEEHWQAIKSLSLREQTIAAEGEILALRERAKHRPHVEVTTRSPFWKKYDRGSKNIIRIGLADLPEGSLPEEVRSSLITHFDNRRGNPTPWGGEPSLGLYFYIDRDFDRQRIGLELMVDTIYKDGGVWMDTHRQGIQIEINPADARIDSFPFKTRVIKNDWGWPQSTYSNAFDGLEKYVGTIPPFQLMRTLVQFAESVVQAKLPQPATAAT